MHRITRWLAYHVLASYGAAAVILVAATTLPIRPAVHLRDFVLAPGVVVAAPFILTRSSHPFAPVEWRFWILIFVWALTYAGIAAPYVLHRRRMTLLAARKAGGLCLRCGYDLRATYDRCPECGSSVSANVDGPDRTT